MIVELFQAVQICTETKGDQKPVSLPQLFKIELTNINVKS